MSVLIKGENYAHSCFWLPMGEFPSPSIWLNNICTRTFKDPCLDLKCNIASDDGKTSKSLIHQKWGAIIPFSTRGDNCRHFIISLKIYLGCTTFVFKNLGVRLAWFSLETNILPNMLLVLTRTISTSDSCPNTFEVKTTNHQERFTDFSLKIWRSSNEILIHLLGEIRKILMNGRQLFHSQYTDL